MDKKLIVMAVLACFYGVTSGCNGDTTTNIYESFFAVSNEGDVSVCDTCPEDETPCEHPQVLKSCTTSTGENPTGCHGGVAPLEPLPQFIPCTE